LLEVDAGKAFLPAALDDLLLFDINTLDKIVALEKSPEQDDPDNDKNNADCIFGKSQ
jgi:hypothetical protein